MSNIKQHFAVQIYPLKYEKTYGTNPDIGWINDGHNPAYFAFSTEGIDIDNSYRYIIEDVQHPQPVTDRFFTSFLLHKGVNSLSKQIDITAGGDFGYLQSFKLETINQTASGKPYHLEILKLSRTIIINGGVVKVFLVEGTDLIQLGEYRVDETNFADSTFQWSCSDKSKNKDDVIEDRAFGKVSSIKLKDIIGEEDAISLYESTIVRIKPSNDWTRVTYLHNLNYNFNKKNELDGYSANDPGKYKYEIYMETPSKATDIENMNKATFLKVAPGGNDDEATTYSIISIETDQTYGAGTNYIKIVIEGIFPLKAEENQYGGWEAWENAGIPEDPADPWPIKIEDNTKIVFVEYGIKIPGDIDINKIKGIYTEDGIDITSQIISEINGYYYINPSVKVQSNQRIYDNQIKTQHVDDIQFAGTKEADFNVPFNGRLFGGFYGSRGRLFLMDLADQYEALKNYDTITIGAAYENQIVSFECQAGSDSDSWLRIAQGNGQGKWKDKDGGWHDHSAITNSRVLDLCLANIVEHIIAKVKTHDTNGLIPDGEETVQKIHNPYFNNGGGSSTSSTVYHRDDKWRMENGHLNFSKNRYFNNTGTPDIRGVYSQVMKGTNVVEKDFYSQTKWSVDDVLPDIKEYLADTTNLMMGVSTRVAETMNVVHNDKKYSKSGSNHWSNSHGTTEPYHPENLRELDLTARYYLIGITNINVYEDDLYIKFEDEDTNTYDKTLSELAYGNTTSIYLRPYWNLGRYIKEAKSRFSLITELCQQGMVAGWTKRNGELEFKSVESFSATDVKHGIDIINKKSIKGFKQTSSSKVYNEFNFNYDYVEDKPKNTVSIKGIREFDTFPNEFDANVPVRYSAISLGYAIDQTTELLVGQIGTDTFNLYQQNPSTWNGSHNNIPLGKIVHISFSNGESLRGKVVPYTGSGVDRTAVEMTPYNHNITPTPYGLQFKPQDIFILDQADALNYRTWQDYVTGVTNYNMAKNIWDKCKGGFDATQTINKMPGSRSNLKWAISLNEYYETTTYPEDQEWASNLALRTADWATYQKFQVNYSLPLDKANVTKIDLMKTIAFSDPLLTGVDPVIAPVLQDETGYITKLMYNTSKMTIDITLTFIPSAFRGEDYIPDCNYIIEDQHNVDEIVEGVSTDEIVEKHCDL